MNDCSPKTGAPVLLIEDTPSLRLVYESALKNAGVPVLSVATAAEGKWQVAGGARYLGVVVGPKVSRDWLHIVLNYSIIYIYFDLFT